jgi:hypothetical protein
MKSTLETDALRDLFEKTQNLANMGDVWDLCEQMERERDDAREIAENLHRWMTESLKSHGQGFLPEKLPWK